MPTETPNQTRIDLRVEARAKLVQLLNARLADAVDYRLQLKQAHWNVKGREFIALHEMFDEMASQVDAWADMIAERGVTLGGLARGTLQAAMAGTTLPAYPVEATAAVDHLRALADRLSKLSADVRASIDESERLGDRDTADLFTEVSRGLDKQMWYLEAHLAD
jgi:starvation-inducible DNA-binding protein